MTRYGWRRGLAVTAAAAALVAGTGCARSGSATSGAHPLTAGSAGPERSGKPTAPPRPPASTAPGTIASGGTAPGSAAAGTAASPDPNKPATFAPQVRTYAGRAGIDPQLLMAILYNESYKPHDPNLERAWQRIDPNAAFGIANMHRAAFDDAKRGRDFADRDWTELPDDPALAIEAAAWYLHDLAADLPAHWPARYTRDELLALGYNTGAGSMKEFAGGARPGAVAQSYLDRLHDNWAAAGAAVR
jgi:soluble lytic murein transglycosylase-like protein